MFLKFLFTFINILFIFILSNYPKVNPDMNSLIIFLSFHIIFVFYIYISIKSKKFQVKDGLVKSIIFFVATYLSLIFKFSYLILVSLITLIIFSNLLAIFFLIKEKKLFYIIYIFCTFYLILEFINIIL